MSRTYYDNLPVWQKDIFHNGNVEKYIDSSRDDEKKLLRGNRPIPINFLVFFTMGTLPFLLTFFSRRNAPVVFDKRRMMIYTLKKNKLYYSMVYDLNMLPFFTNREAMEDKRIFIPLVVMLSDEAPKKAATLTTPFPVGPFFNECPCQQKLMSIILAAYFSRQNKNSNDEWLSNLSDKQPSLINKYLDKLSHFSVFKPEDPFAPDVQRRLDVIAQRHKNLKMGDLDFPGFDFSIRKSA